MPRLLPLLLLVAVAALPATAQTTRAVDDNIGAPTELLVGRPQRMSLGIEHTCGVAQGGGGRCWGQNSEGRLGDGTLTSRLTPTPVVNLSDLVAISSGYSITCGLTQGGAVYCWGFYTFTNTSSRVPVLMPGLTSGVRAIDAGDQHACALTDGGAVLCWGVNRNGQLGDGTTTSRRDPVPVSGLGSGVVAISAGPEHTCAVLASGGVRCWGANGFGAIGDGTQGPGTNRLVPTPVSGLTNAVDVSAGGGHTCAVTAGGAALCWGWNANGTLGTGSQAPTSPLPVPVSGLSSGVRAVSAGYSHTCAVRTSGGALCWGYNIYGEVGTGRTGDGTYEYYVPQQVVGLTSGVSEISAGNQNSCALMGDGGMRCWGRNLHGEHGDGTTTGHITPVAVSGGTIFPPVPLEEPLDPTDTGVRRVYPNPASGRVEVEVEVSAASAVSVEVLDLLGRRVDRVEAYAGAAGLHRLALDAGALPPGTYVVRVVAEGTASARLLTVVR